MIYLNLIHTSETIQPKKNKHDYAFITTKVIVNVTSITDPTTLNFHHSSSHSNKSD